MLLYAIKPSQISKGQGIGVVPGAMMGIVITVEIFGEKYTEPNWWSSTSGLKWHISEFKDVANETDSCDER